MTRREIERIREGFRHREYDMTAHAWEEMSEDLLDLGDVESAVLNGQVLRIEKDDPRGTKFVVKGLAADGSTPVGVVVRLSTTGRPLIVTVYEVTEPKG